ncbi:hypothetical protein IC611_16305 [Proteus mirabilis]
MTRNLRIKEEMTNDIISNLPIGLLVYNFSSNHKIISNSHAEKLLPHIDLSKIRQMAVEHNGLIQTVLITKFMRSAPVATAISIILLYSFF